MLRLVKMNKKGFAIVFNWLFSVIAGILILLFFVWFAVQNTDLFGNVTSQRAVEELDIAFTSFKSSLIGTTLNFGKPIELEFRCNSDTLQEEKMFINKKSGKSLKGKVVFAPSNLNANEFILWTTDWKIPFKVTNFIFLTSKNKKYDLSDLPGSHPLRLKLPKKNGVDLFNVGNDGEKIGLRQTNSGLVEAPLLEGSKQIYFDYDRDLDDFYGTIVVGSEQYPFVGDAMIYAAIFSDESNFDCLYDKAIDKARTINKFNSEKMDRLVGIGECAVVAGNLGNILENTLIHNNFNFVNIEEVRDVQKDNDRMLARSCEGLY